MLNQAAVEALYSATYIENYLDCVEDLPDNLARLISRALELDVTYRAFLSEAQQQQEVLIECDSVSKKKYSLIKIQQALIAAQEIGDEKLEIIQQIQDMIENKSRQLDLDHRHLVSNSKSVYFASEGAPGEFAILEDDKVDLSKEQESSDTTKETSNGTTTAPINNNGNNTNERSSKRVRRTRTDTAPSVETPLASEVIPTPEPVRQVASVQPTTPLSSTTTTNPKKSGNITTGKKKKRKSRQSSQHQQQQQQHQQHQSQMQADDSPPHEDEMAIDPDEPTYCLCHQISYGEMIMCDNDLCPYEWFHFSCVSLNVKPKGKWYCPKCRGERSSVMKPKAQFLKELDRYNKEKEMKDEKD